MQHKISKKAGGMLMFKGKVFLGLVLSVLVLVAGCSIPLRYYKPLKEPKASYSGKINVEVEVENRKLTRFGWGTFTVFGIPVVPVRYRKGNANEVIMDLVSQALAKSGYAVSKTNDSSDVSNPTVRCKVNKLFFHNYTWLFPVIITWGKVNWTLELVNSSGDILWSDKVSAPGFSLHLLLGHSVAAKRALYKLGNRMVKKFTSEEFHQALKNN